MKRNLIVMIVALGMVFGCVLGSQAQETAPEIKQWDFTYDGSALPAGQSFPGGVLSGGIIAEVKDGILHLTDKSTEPGATGYEYLWKATSENEATVEARAKVVLSKSAAAVCLGVANGSLEDYLTLYEDRIELGWAKLSYPMDTTDDFHIYRITIKDKDIKVYVDGKLRIDGSGKLIQPAAYGGRNHMFFGSGSPGAVGESYWDWARYYVAGKVKAEKGTVKVEKTQILFESKEDINFPNWAQRFKDGTIWIKFITGQHNVNEKMAAVSSADDGKTWKSGGVPGEPGNTWVEPDGRIIQVTAMGPKPLRGTVYPVTVERFKNHQSAAEIIKTEVELPWEVGTAVCRSLIRTADGKLISTAYGKVKGESLDRSYCITSNDDGKTWKFLSTIAYGYKIGDGSYVHCSEVVLAQLANGDLLSLIRTDGPNTPESGASPLIQTRSIDGGKTWEVPHEVALRSADPDLKLLSSGILVSTFGRPQGLLMVDFDGTGEEWDGTVTYYTGEGCKYTSILEMEPNLIMVIYTESSFCGGGRAAAPLNRLMAAYIRIEKK